MNLSRREFVAGAVVATACASCAFGAEQAAPAAPVGAFDAGELAKIKEGVTDTFVKSNKVFIVRKGNVVFAESAVCTHKACVLKVVDNEPRCGCHGSRFDTDGKAKRGPATDTLKRYGVSVNDGKLMVDTSKTFSEADFGKDGASVKL